MQTVPFKRKKRSTTLEPHPMTRIKEVARGAADKIFFFNVELLFFFLLLWPPILHPYSKSHPHQSKTILSPIFHAVVKMLIKLLSLPSQDAIISMTSREHIPTWKLHSFINKLRPPISLKKTTVRAGHTVEETGTAHSWKNVWYVGCCAFPRCANPPPTARRLICAVTPACVTSVPSPLGHGILVAKSGVQPPCWAGEHWDCKAHVVIAFTSTSILFSEQTQASWVRYPFFFLIIIKKWLP